MSNITSIIFDLGGVLLNNDIKRTQDQFRKLGVHNIDERFGFGHASAIFMEYEKGLVDDQQFVEALKRATGLSVSDQEIIDSWNAMLIDFPKERIEWLKELRKKYRLFLFSNTNAIHLETFRQIYRSAHGGTSLDELFEKAYYSHLIKMRKPELAAFEFILKENNLKPSETVFVDDFLMNVEAARKVGMKGIHLEPGMSVLDLEL